ncbi:hypothetical protein [Longispora albida]|uniref:hypothetical protein n=1 Tax=Longispora albida TaxID=203523 RepID=UPI0012FC3EF0|nr:hypothetical protein [Longispora albida]
MSYLVSPHGHTGGQTGAPPGAHAAPGPAAAEPARQLSRPPSRGLDGTLWDAWCRR